MAACAAALDLPPDATSVAFGKLGKGQKRFPNYQVTCGGASFVFESKKHLPYPNPSKDLLDYMPCHFRRGTFTPGNLHPGTWVFAEISRYATDDTSENDDGLFERDLEETYKGIILPLPAYDPDPGNAKRRMVANRVAQRARDFRDRLLAKQGEPSHCAVCDMSIRSGLQGAHVVDVRHGGKDIVENGLVLCGTHHLLFDADLFGVDPTTLEVRPRSKGPYLEEMQITRKVICEAVGHKALSLRWHRFQATNQGQ